MRVDAFPTDPPAPAAAVAPAFELRRRRSLVGAVVRLLLASAVGAFAAALAFVALLVAMLTAEVGSALALLFLALALAAPAAGGSWLAVWSRPWWQTSAAAVLPVGLASAWVSWRLTSIGWGVGFLVFAAGVAGASATTAAIRRTLRMTLDPQLSEDRAWWGRGDLWSSVWTLDGGRRWDGMAWAPEVQPRPPAVLEAMDPPSLEANRRGEVSWAQALRLAAGTGGRYVAGAFRVPTMWSWLYLTVVPLAVPLLALVTAPLVVAGSAVDCRLLGIEAIEGVAWTDDRRRYLGERPVRLSRRMQGRLVEDGVYRLYRTRTLRLLVNYELVALPPP